MMCKVLTLLFTDHVETLETTEVVETDDGETRPLGPLVPPSNIIPLVTI